REMVALLIVAVPVVAPSVSVVAAPPTLRVVALALKREAEVLLVVISPPASARSPLAVTSPLLAIVNQVVPDADAVKISWFSIWSSMVKALPVAPRESGRVTVRAAFGVEVPIPRSAFGAATVRLLIVAVPVV